MQQHFGYVHISVGALLKEAIKKGGADAQLIKEQMSKRTSVPREVVFPILKHKLEAEAAAGKTGFVFDGFPRNSDEYINWKKEGGAFADFSLMIFLDAAEDELRKRAIALHGPSYAQRFDEEAALFDENTRPALEMMLKQGLARRVLSPASWRPEHVFAQMVKVLAPLNFPRKLPEVTFVLGGPGCGKGTQCEKLEQYGGYVAISAGELLREFCASGAPEAKQINDDMKAGNVCIWTRTYALGHVTRASIVVA